MTKHDVAALACKILAIYAVVVALGNLQLIYATILSMRGVPASIRNAPEIVVGALFTPAILVILAIFLWLRSDQIATYMIPDGGEESAGLRISSLDIQAIAFSVVGLFVLVGAMPRAVEVILQVFLARPPGAMLSLLNPQLAPQIGRSVAELLIGFYLLFRSRWLVELLRADRRQRRHWFVFKRYYQEGHGQEDTT